MRIESFLKQSPVFQISLTARRLDALLARILRQEEVTFFEALVLAAIFFEKKHGVKPSELAATFQTTRGNMSQCISSLEAKGLVRRRMDPNDARALQLTLLPTGKKRATRVVGILHLMQGHFEQIVGTKGLESMAARIFAVESVCSGLAQNADQRPESGLDEEPETIPGLS
jgi:DNA-binding MarR family transcriptional regulator